MSAPAPGSAPGIDERDVRELARVLEDLDASQRAWKLHHQYGGTYDGGHHWNNPLTGDEEGGPYSWQLKFHAAGATHRYRAIIAANQVGKSRTAAAEVAMHLTGWYPTWWTGRRFEHAIEATVANETNLLLRDVNQTQLVGKMIEGEPDGTGWIPRPLIGEHKKRQCGASDVIDYVLVKHVTGAWSTLFFKSYEQGVGQFQGFQRDVFWPDEEPTTQHAEFLSEILTRVMKRKGIVLFTRTPLQGMTPFIRFFMAAGADQRDDVWYINVGWEDAPHFTAEQIAQEIANTPEHLRLAKSKGIPQLGSGPVYTFPDTDVAIDAIEIAPHWRRLCAMDFGVDHPTAAVWFAHDPESDVVYLYDAYRARRETSIHHAQAIKARPCGEDIPVAWPHDGLKQEASSGLALMEIYRRLGLRMLPLSARYDDDHGGGQSPEPAIEMITARARTGRFKVVRHLHEWFDEKRMYHRENGHIVKEDDDLMAATNYGIMMLRYARIVGRARDDRLRRLQHQHQNDEHGYRPLGRYAASS